MDNGTLALSHDRFYVVLFMRHMFDKFTDLFIMLHLGMVGHTGQDFLGLASQISSLLL
jgi:hypothetical protein